MNVNVNRRSVTRLRLTRIPLFLVLNDEHQLTNANHTAMKNIIRSLSVGLLLATALPASNLRAAEVCVFAPPKSVSSRPPASRIRLRKLPPPTKKDRRQDCVQLRRIRPAGPTDRGRRACGHFFSADEARMDALEKKGLIMKETRRSLLSNLLVIVTAADSSPAIASPKDLASPGAKRIALGDRSRRHLLEGVSHEAGTVARRESEGCAVRKCPRGAGRRRIGERRCGHRLQDRRRHLEKVKVAFEVAAKDGPKISYPLALVKDSKQPEAARKFLEHLAGPGAGEVFVRRGFILLPAEEKK